MPKIRKYTDWRGWWDGLRSNFMKCLGTTGTAYLATNGIANTSGAQGIAIDWKQALLYFGVHLGLEVFGYLKQNQPKVIEEIVEDTMTASNSKTGEQISQTTKTTTTTPLPAADATKPNP